MFKFIKDNQSQPTTVPKLAVAEVATVCKSE